MTPCSEQLSLLEDFKNDPLAYDSLCLLDSIYKMTPRPIIALQNDPPAYDSLAK